MVSEKLRRRSTSRIEEDLKKKMVLVVGPRQCGKTTLAREILAKRGGAYYSWDIAAHRAALRAGTLDASSKLWVFDELHKFRQWRNWLKGVWDEHHRRHQVLVTGSARLDVYSRGGDSLQGRYFKHRLHPLTLGEVEGLAGPSSLDGVTQGLFEGARKSPGRGTLESLLTLGGFPEPFLEGDATFAKRWRISYGELLVREDVRALEVVRDLDRLELLFERLPGCVGSVLSINALREDLEVAFETVRRWIGMLENVYACFRVPPFGAPRLKAVKKEQKLYCWDWARVDDPAARFENLVAVHLVRFVDWARDVLGEPLELRYFRDTVGHEVDFILQRGRTPWLAVECKSSPRPLDSGLKYLLERVKIPWAVQISATGSEHVHLPRIGASEVHRMSADRFLAALP